MGTRPNGCVASLPRGTLRRGKSMRAAFRTSAQMTFEDFDSAIFSQASGFGATPCVSPAGLTTAPCGPALAPVSPSVPPASGEAMPTNATSGRCGSGSSASAALQASLASRLAARMPYAGSTLYRMTWKERVTPSGRRICALRASAHRTSDKGYSGWPATTAALADKGVRSFQGAVIEAMRTRGADLAAAVSLTGWPTAAARDWKSSASNLHGVNACPLNEVARLSGWGTPKTTMGDWQKDATGAVCLNLSGQAKLAGPPRLTACGQMLTGSDARMAAGGQLNPAHSRWLMGLPVAWDCCGATAMQLSRRSRRNSSGRQTKLSEG